MGARPAYRKGNRRRPGCLIFDVLAGCPVVNVGHMAKSDRVPLNSPQAGLNSAFSGLGMAGLPPAPPEPAQPLPSSKAKPGRVVLRREKSGRSGKTVIVVDDFASHHTAAELEE